MTDKSTANTIDVEIKTGNDHKVKHVNVHQSIQDKDGSSEIVHEEVHDVNPINADIEAVNNEIKELIGDHKEKDASQESEIEHNAEDIHSETIKLEQNDNDHKNETENTAVTFI